MSAPQRILRIAARFLRSMRFCEALAEICAINYRKLLSCSLSLVPPSTRISSAPWEKHAENLCSKWGGFLRVPACAIPLQISLPITFRL
jgi:hypothetical protein